MAIRVALVDDQALIRAGFRSIIESASDIEVVGEAADGNAALTMLDRIPTDVVLMDIRMPELDGIETTRQIVDNPAQSSVRVIILTTFELDEYVVESLRAGASGFLDKGVEPDTLLDAIRIVAAGDALLTPKATRALLARFTIGSPQASLDDAAIWTLTDRERELTGLAGHGLSNDEIAQRLHLSPLTVKTHINRAMNKLNVRDRAQLVITALRTGLATLDEVPPPDRNQ